MKSKDWKEMLRSAGYASQRELARDVRIPETTLSMILHGRLIPTTSERKRLLGALGRDIVEFVRPRAEVDGASTTSSA